MLEQLGNPVNFHFFYVENKQGREGLTVTADVWEIDTDGNRTEIIAAAPCVETGDGLYLYRLAGGQVDTKGELVAVGKTATNTVEQQDIPAVWVIDRAGIGFLDAAISAIAAAVWDYLTALCTTASSIGELIVTKLGLITAGEIVYGGPVAEGGDVVTYRGDAYQDADDRALEWESDDWPNLTGATIAVIIDHVGTFAGTVVTPTGTAVVRLELTGTQSATIPAKKPHLFQVVATTVPGGDQFTLVEAIWVSRDRATGV